jgi:AraC-like DNA-binding protein
MHGQSCEVQEMNGRHSLSQLAGNYREWAPNVGLRDHVRCLWVNDLSSSNARVPLAEFWGGESERLFDRASECGESKLVAAILEGALMTRLPKVGQPDRGIGFLRQAAAAKHRPLPRGVKALAGRIGVSERTIRRRCMDAFGYGFKTLDRILRLQRFFRLAEASAHPRLVELAAQAGYADQAHLTREVQRLCGATPSELVAQFSAQLADSFKTPHA